MKQLYAPWRESYSASLAQNKSGSALTADECVFCSSFNDNTDEQHLIFRRFSHMIVMLNLFPYNAGHILILPIAHIANLDELSPQARCELIELTTHATTIVKEVLGCHGVNVGLNLGKAAGAGIPNHLHMHVLPRFAGDTNFLPVLADTKQISFDLPKMYQKLKPSFDNIVFTQQL
ncbi:MAG: HIT domain-containing protein [Candidatus Babeliales bacterium]|nr:HIT domain-containing protein [Candidatus Babeliales bacterium]